MPGSSILLIYTACCFLLPTVSNVPLGHSAVQQTGCCWLGFWATSSVCLLLVQDAQQDVQAFLRTLLEAVQWTNSSIGHPPFMLVLWSFNTVFMPFSSYCVERNCVLSNSLPMWTIRITFDRFLIFLKWRSQCPIHFSWRSFCLEMEILNRLLKCLHMR